MDTDKHRREVLRQATVDVLEQAHELAASTRDLIDASRELRAHRRDVAPRVASHRRPRQVTPPDQGGEAGD
jgi:uncharacterized coiled-coil DUF342 family protein